MKPGHIKTDETELNSETKTFPVQDHLTPKAMQVDLKDPHAQAKREGVGYANTAKQVVKSPWSAADLLDKGERETFWQQVGPAKAKKAQANGRADHEAQTRTNVQNIAADLLAEIRSRWPHESDIKHIVRFRRAIENSTDADVLEAFCSEEGECIEILVAA